MRVLCLLAVICFIALGAHASTPVSARIPEELTRATELERKGDLKGAERVLFDFIEAAEASKAVGALCVAMGGS